MMYNNFITPSMVECKSLREMFLQAGYSNNHLVLGTNGGVHICISHATHYYVVLDEAYREKAMRWMQQHIKHLGRESSDNWRNLNREAVLDALTA